MLYNIKSSEYAALHLFISMSISIDTIPRFRISWNIASSSFDVIDRKAPHVDGSLRKGFLSSIRECSQRSPPAVYSFRPSLRSRATCPKL